jgi:hypothetical protein
MIFKVTKFLDLEFSAILSLSQTSGRKRASVFILKALGIHTRHASSQTMSESKRFQLTPEQLALSEQRKAKKATLSENSAPTKYDKMNSRILSRKWVQLPIAPGQDIGRRVKVLTWNVSAIRSSRMALN